MEGLEILVSGEFARWMKSEGFLQEFMLSPKGEAQLRLKWQMNIDNVATIAKGIGAVYVWVNSMLGYPKALARAVGRGDLRIVGPHMLEVLAHRKMVVDHAAVLTNRQLECIREGEANGRV